MIVDSVEDLLERYAEGERDFGDSELEGGNLEGAQLEGVNLCRANLRGAKLNGARLEGAQLAGASLEGASLVRADLSCAKLSRANLCEADLTGATLTGANLDGAFLERALLIRALLESCDLVGADLSAADLVGASLETADLEGANLSDANLTGANLHWAKLTWANLTNTRFNWARLSWANGEAADFEGANLSGADMQAAKLCCARFSGARMTGANLHFADLCGADLQGIIGQAGLVASCRIDRDTYTRSQWTPEQLLEWHAAGATVVELDSFPVDARQSLCAHQQGLRLSFNVRLSAEDRALLEWLALELCGQASGCHLSVHSSSPLVPGSSSSTGDTICFDAPNESDLESLVDALQGRIWEESSDGVSTQSPEAPTPMFSSMLDSTRQRLSSLAAGIMRMELLGSGEQAEEVRSVAEELREAELEGAVGPLSEERRAVRSWTRLPAVRRDPPPGDEAPAVGQPESPSESPSEDTDPGEDPL